MKNKSFYNRPIGVSALLLTILLFGGLSLQQLQITLFPDGIQAETIQISTYYDAASPDEMLDEVVRPMEEILRAVPGVKSIRSTFKTRRLTMTVLPDQDRDISILTRNINEAFDDHYHRFPNNFRRPKISVGSSDDIPMTWLSFSSPNRTQKQFEQILTREIFPVILETKGVGSLSHTLYEGGLIDISFDSDKVSSGSIPMRGVISHLSASKPRSLSSEMIDNKGNLVDTPIHLSTENLDQQGIRDLPVSSTHRLSDVAHFKEQPFGDFSYTMIGGGPGEFVQVFKASDANSYRTSERVVENLKPVVKRLGMDMEVHVATHSLINAASKELITSAWIGGLGALALLMFFLKRWRMALFISLSLPLSLTLSLMAQSIQEISVSIPTMIGYILAIGMVIDNSIVVGESLIRLGREEDLIKRTQLVKKAVSDVALPILVSTLTTLAIFAPLMFIEITGAFKVMIMSIGLPVAWSLIGSLFLALCVLPIAYLYAYPKGSTEKKKPFWLEKLIQSYRYILQFIFKHPWISAIACLGIIIPGPYFMVKDMQNSKHLFESKKDLRILHMKIRVRTRPSAEELERDLKKWHDQIWAKHEALGLRSIAFTIRRRSGTALFAFHPTDPLGRDSESLREEIVALVNPTLNIAFPEHFRKSSTPSKASSPLRSPIANKKKQGKKGTPGQSPRNIKLILVGQNQDALNEKWETFSKHLKNVDGVQSIDEDSDKESGDIVLQLRPESAQSGFTPDLVSAALRPLTVRKNILFLENHWILRVGPSYRDEIPYEDLMATSIQNEQGVSRTLDSLVTRGSGPAQSRINRRDGLSYNDYRFMVEKGAYQKVIDQLPKVSQDAGLSWGSDIMLDWEAQESHVDFDQAMIAIAMAIFLIYLIMGILYESFLAPIAVMATVPLTMVSIFSWMFLFEIQLSMMVILGLLFLIGIVVNNGIVLIDQLRKVVPLNQIDGKDQSIQYLAQAACLRFTPICLTSLTTITGGIAMAVGESKIAGISIRELGLTMAIGLSGATFFTLFIVPLVYVFIGRLVHLCKQLTARVFRYQVKAEL